MSKDVKEKVFYGELLDTSDMPWFIATRRL